MRAPGERRQTAQHARADRHLQRAEFARQHAGVEHRVGGDVVRTARLLAQDREPVGLRDVVAVDGLEAQPLHARDHAHQPGPRERRRQQRAGEVMAVSVPASPLKISAGRRRTTRS